MADRPEAPHDNPDNKNGPPAKNKASGETFYLCRQCFDYGPTPIAQTHCPQCHSRRLLHHPELFSLTLAHVDCDAFFAAVEKRDRPDLADKPLIIGGLSGRGVVSTACYIARMDGVHSAMPMYKARQLCPKAVFLPPDIAKYRIASASIRRLMESLTPLVEPLALDEAFLELKGTERLHHGPAALLLAQLAQKIEDQIGITVSVGLSYNKFLAKMASDLNKPKGFSVIGRAEALDFLAPLPVSRLPGIGKRMTEILAQDGMRLIAHLHGKTEKSLIRRYGEIGQSLWRYSHALDNRSVTPNRPAKSLSSEVTFTEDLSDRESLERFLWQQCERLSKSAKRKALAGATVTLKVKTNKHRILTRSETLYSPTQLAETLFEVGKRLLDPLVNGQAYRLLGIGLSQFRPLLEADQPDLVRPELQKKAKAEQAIDSLRRKFGDGAIIKGRTLGKKP